MSLVTQISSVVTAIGTEFKSAYAKIGTLANLTTTAKGDLVSAINELVGSIGGAGATINDSAPSTTAVYSSSKTESVATAAAAALIDDSAAADDAVYSSQKTADAIAAAITALVDGADGAMDTLKELADAINDDGTSIGTITTALGNRLQFDAAQSLTSGEKAQGNANLGSLSLVNSGDPTTDFAAVFTAALA